jgi:galactonate dehydratase
MKIRSVQTIPYRRSVVVKITSDAGVVGWGECTHSLSAEQAKDLERIQGQDAESYEVHRRTLLDNPAQGAVNMALLDILGQAAKAPVYQLLGGPTRFKVRAMISAGLDPVLGFEGLQKRGHRAFVVPTGTAAGPRQDFVSGVRKRFDGLRQRLGDGCDFVVDGMGALTPAEAQQVSHAIEDFHPLWFDEPCPMVNLGAARKIAEENVTPLGWGRHMTDLAQVQEVLREQMCDVVRLDVGRHGISSIRKAAALAETYYVAVAPFHRGGPIATAAALHLAASLPNFFIQQMPQPEDDDAAKRRADLVGAEIEKVTEGYLSLPTGPGLGIKVNEELLRRNAA